KGKTEIAASLMRNGKRVGLTKATVNVLRAVNKVTLNTSKLSVYDPDDLADDAGRDAYDKVYDDRGKETFGVVSGKGEREKVL
ncbi:MAG: hypothetical protein J5569_07460, partial [Oscillospiraceae bacterium]|nr:hypothetical protein [Oscillospiraceae bacterium]